MSKRNLALIAATLVSIIYGITFTVAKDVMPAFVKPFGFIVLRVGGSAILFWICSLFVRKEKIALIDFSAYCSSRFFWCSTKHAYLF